MCTPPSPSHHATGVLPPYSPAIFDPAPLTVRQVSCRHHGQASQNKDKSQGMSFTPLQTSLIHKHSPLLLVVVVLRVTCIHTGSATMYGPSSSSHLRSRWSQMRWFPLQKSKLSPARTEMRSRPARNECLDPLLPLTMNALPASLHCCCRLPPSHFHVPRLCHTSMFLP